MQRTMFKSKIHRAKVTMADLNYEGSITIDENLLDLADIVPYEKVSVWNITNGQRFEAYALSTKIKGTVCVNGAAARLVSPGDRIIIATFTQVEFDEYCKKWQPTIVIVDENNDPL